MPNPSMLSTKKILVSLSVRCGQDRAGFFYVLSELSTLSCSRIELKGWRPDFRCKTKMGIATGEAERPASIFAMLYT